MICAFMELDPYSIQVRYTTHSGEYRSVFFAQKIPKNFFKQSDTSRTNTQRGVLKRVHGGRVRPPLPPLDVRHHLTIHLVFCHRNAPIRTTDAIDGSGIAQCKEQSGTHHQGKHTLHGVPWKAP